MLRNARPLVPLVLAVAVALVGAGCGGDDARDDTGVAFAVYADDAVGDRVDDGSLRCGTPRAVCPPNLRNPTGSYTYEPTGEPALGPDDTAGAKAEGGGSSWSVTIELTGAGAEQFTRLTQRLAQEGAEAQRLRHAAVVVGEEIVAFAEVDYELYPQGIQTTSLELFAVDEADAKRIADRVNEEVEARS
jgi:preprotein translocase subunit SecD